MWGTKIEIQYFCNCRIGHDCGSDLMPCPGTSHTLVAKKEKDYLKVVLAGSLVTSSTASLFLVSKIVRNLRSVSLLILHEFCGNGYMGGS